MTDAGEVQLQLVTVGPSSFALPSIMGSMRSRPGAWPTRKERTSYGLAVKTRPFSHFMARRLFVCRCSRATRRRCTYGVERTPAGQFRAVLQLAPLALSA